MGAGIILLTLLIFRSATTWPGLIIMLLGIPVYLFIRMMGQRDAAPDVVYRPPVPDAQKLILLTMGTVS